MKSSSSEVMILELKADGSMTQTEKEYSMLDCTGSVTSGGTSYTYYTIFKLEGDRFNWGKISGGNDGLTEANRHIELGTDEDDIYHRQ